jgi:glycosyltransferase involved in cell wall biosynthesis
LILFVDAAHPPASDDLSMNEERYGPITRVPLIREPPLVRAANELWGRDMYYHGWRLAPGSEPLSPPPGGVLIVSPMSAAAKWRRLKSTGHIAAGVSVAAVNDCTSAQYYLRGKQSFGGIQLKWRGLMDRWRSVNVARIERYILSEYDHVLLQTPTDRELMRDLVGETIARHVTIAPNGVRAELLSVEPDRQSRQITLVSELSGEYAPVARWLVAEVWPIVLREQPDATLQVIGKGADARLKERINGSPGVSYIPFVEDLAEVYHNTLAVVSPVFKGYGLINKTIEAMASGVPVVGGASAFNGIEGFEPGRDGILCKTTDASGFAQAIIALIKDVSLCNRIGESGRSLIKGRFVWSRTLETIESLLCAEPGSNPFARDCIGGS